MLGAVRRAKLPPVKPRDRDRLKDKLLALKTEILAEGDLQLEPTRKDVTEVGGDEDEQPLAEMNQIINSKRNRARTDVLARVLAALKRLDEAPDEFGLCRTCDEELHRENLIPPGRQLLPTATPPEEIKPYIPPNPSVYKTIPQGMPIEVEQVVSPIVLEGFRTAGLIPGGYHPLILESPNVND